MVYNDRLEEVADRLGYRDTSGFVHGTARTEVGARDFVWRDLRDKCQVDAAYFRGAVPLVAFVDADSPDDIGSAHGRLWNFGRVPVLIASTPREVTAVSCVMPPTADPSDNGSVLDSARLDQPLQSVLQEFTRFNVERGRLATAHPKQFDRRLRVDYQLLDNLKRLRINLIRNKLDETYAEQVIGRSIFIRYLEDGGILSQEHMLELGAYPSFIQTLRAGPSAVADLFAALSQHFNGDVFALSEGAYLPPQAINDLYHFFSGTDLGTGQQALWPYDFNIIPPDLISSIYEQLLEEKQRQDAVYYTPRHLVDLVLDELVPWQGNMTEPTILDPACGSGIFLAEAFRRFVYQHTVANGRSPSFENLSRLLKRCIFGVDISPAAISVSAFSLYLALLEHVDPPTAWREARLPVLVGSNLIAADFFEDHPLANRRFDLVVGNPPWRSSLTQAATDYVSEHKADSELPDKQIALAFMWRAVDLTEVGGAVGLVLPAKSLLYNRSLPAEASRRHIFNDYKIETVIDLSPLRRETFGAAISPASIVIARGYRDDNDLSNIVHVAPRRTPLAEAIDGIVVSQDNIRQVSLAVAGTSTVAWKTYLWGDQADLDLVTRLRETFPNLEAVARKNEWTIGQGFQVRGGDRNDASALFGMLLLDTSSVAAMRLSSVPTKTVTDDIMHRPRNPQIYRAPHVIMRKGFRRFPASVFLDFDTAFTDGLFALSGTPSDAEELRVISGLLNSSVAHYWLFMTSSSWGVEREQIQLNEYLSLPIPPVTGVARQEILYVVEAAFGGRSTEDELRKTLDSAVFRAYGITPGEEDLVRDGLEVRLDEYRSGPRSAAYELPSPEDFDAYCEIIASHLNSMESISWNAEFIERSSGFAVVACRAGISLSEYNFDFSIDRLLSMANAPLNEWLSPAAVMQPSVIVVEGTSVYLVKPDERRCWTRSGARSDAGEVLNAVLMAPTTQES